MRTRVKICGITRAEDARVAVGLGADALGFVFWKRSRRYIQPERAGELVRQLPAMVCAVAVVVDPASDELEEIVAKSGVDLVQFHGDESRDFCERAPVPYIKAVRVYAG